MAWWVYKCNGRNQDHQVTFGDWGWFFDRERVGPWGNTETTPSLARLHPGDMVLAYQTDRNELVGLCRVVRLARRGRYSTVYLGPVQRIDRKVRPLKEADPRVAAIPALRPGPIMTLYDISAADARRLLAAAGAVVREGADADTSEETFLEGERRAAAATVRNNRLRAAAKERWGLKCYCCGFDFEQFDGEVARGMAVVHHLEQFAVTGGERRAATVEDVRIVCANCHFVIHADDEPIDVDALKQTVTKRWTAWSGRGVARRRTDSR